MGLFRRKSRNADVVQPRSGSPVDLPRYGVAVADGTLPGLPENDRYWVVRADSYDDGEGRLLWEKAATHREAKQALKAFQKECGTKPQRISQSHFDDVDGTWVAQPRGRPDAMLSITHPRTIGVNGRFKDMLAASGFDRDPDFMEHFREGDEFMDQYR